MASGSLALRLLTCLCLCPLSRCARVVTSRLIKLEASTGAELCDPAIVRETCSLLKSPSATNPDVIYAARLSYRLHVHEDSVLSFLQAIGVHNVEPTGPFTLTCQELCEKTVENLPVWRRPPYSDVICYHTSESDDSVECGMSIADLPEFPDRSAEDLLSQDPGHEQPMGEVPGASPVDKWISVARKLEVAQKRPAKEISYLEVVVANLFRIFPPARIDITSGDAQVLPAHTAEKLGLGNGEKCSVVANAIPAVGFHPISKRTCKCPRNMVLAGDDPQCGSAAKHSRKFKPSTLKGRLCYCRQPEFVRQDCMDVTSQCASRVVQCHLPHVQDECPSTCGLACEDLLHGWKRDIWKAGASAQVHVTKALRLLGDDASAATMEFWLGGSSAAHKKEVLRILNGLNEMLLAMEFRYDVPACGMMTYGFVYPNSYLSKNEKDEYIVYLCPLWMEVSLGVQVETITHEGSHHYPLAAIDMCMDGISSGGPSCVKAYGREKCRDLAIAAPDGAVKNADNLCYFINDLVVGRNEVYGPESAVYAWVARHQNSTTSA